MFKHKINKNVIFKGKTYIPQNGIVTLPEKVDMYNPIEEKKDDSEKDELVAKAVGLGLGAESTLKRNSVETLKKKIAEAE